MLGSSGCGVYWISVYAGGIHHPPPPPPRHFHNVLRHCGMSGRTFHNVLRHCSKNGRTFHNVLYNVWLLPSVAVVKLSSGLVVVITDSDILPTPVSHICLCTRIRWIPRDTFSDIYRVVPFPWRLGIWLLVSCLPVL